MVALSRRVLRTLIQLSVISLVGALIFLVDLYVDFIPSSIRTKIPQLYPSDPVIVDIVVHRCLFGASCPPDGKGGYAKLSKDLFLGSSWVRRGHVYVAEVPESELKKGEKVVQDIATANIAGALPARVLEDVFTNSNAVDGSNPEEVLAMAAKLGWRERDSTVGLWLKFGKNWPGTSVTEVKVLFGHDAVYPLPGWVLLDDPLIIGGGEDYENSDIPAPRLAFRIGRTEVDTPHLTGKASASSRKSFKIVQLADLHMVTDYGKCQSPANLGSNCRADHETTLLISQVLSDEDPDLVVYSGDQIFGSESLDPETAMLKALAPAIERKIPFTVVFGNHDNQGSLSNQELMSIVEQLPYSLARAGPANVTGVGNYHLTVPSTGKPDLILYFLDSHTNSHHRGRTSYDSIDPGQLELLKEFHNNIIEQHGPISSHDVLSMAFWHIPIPEFRSEGRLRIGTAREAVTGPAQDFGTLDTLRQLGVSVLSVGHDHCNDYCQLDEGDSRNLPGVWLCYGGGAGYGGYGGYPDSEGNLYERRVRIYDIDLTTNSIDTWKRVESEQGVYQESTLIVNSEPVV